MTRSFSRIAAAAILAAGGLAIAAVVFAIAAAKVVIAADIPGVVVRPGDAALLDDLVAVAPFVAAFAIADLVAALGLLSGRTWADRFATAVATVATSVGVFAFVLLAIGQDTLAIGSRAAAAADGLGIIATFTGIYAAAIVALAFAGSPERGPDPHLWTIPGAA